MKKIRLIISFLLLNISFVLAQTKTEMDSLLNIIGEIENSKHISKTEETQKIIEIGANSLIILADFFTDQTKTNVYSDCQNRTLIKGEIAIIIADRIEGMPFAKLTGVQNCLLEFCKDNPNLIEYYFPWIAKDEAITFKQKYTEWLNSKERKKSINKN